jgi:hypothetical protein
VFGAAPLQCYGTISILAAVLLAGHDSRIVDAAHTRTFCPRLNSVAVAASTLVPTSLTMTVEGAIEKTIPQGSLESVFTWTVGLSFEAASGK